MTTVLKLPRLEAGEKLVRAAGLVLVFAPTKRLVYFTCEDGRPFGVSRGAYLVLELLARRPGFTVSYDQVLERVYGTYKKVPITVAYNKADCQPVRILRRAFFNILGTKPIISHYGIGYSLEG